MGQLGKNPDMQKFYPEALQIAAVDHDTSEISFKMYSYTQSCKCPKCSVESFHKHGTYERKVQDLPVLGKRTYLLVNAFEYQCDNPECDVTTFAESIDGFLCHFGRMTGRLADFVCDLALETSCESCAKILQKINVRISGDTVIRLLNRRYGASLKGRLEQNKHVTAVTRDRASAYAKAIEEILPDCMQTAYHFHLYQNLMDAVRKIPGREIPATNIIAIEGASLSSGHASPSRTGSEEGTSSR